MNSLLPADWLSEILHLTSQISTFSNELLSVPVRFSLQHYVGEVTGFSLNGVNCVPHRWFNVPIQSTDLWTWVFEFVLVFAEQLTSPSSVGDQNLSDFIQSNFFAYCFLIPFFLVAQMLNALIVFRTLISSVHLNKLVDALVGREFHVQIT